MATTEGRGADSETEPVREALTFRTRLLALAAVLALAIPVAGVGARGVAQAHDLGDAPDARAAGYATKPDVVGSFPSRAARGGPRHAGGGVRLGAGWTREADSRQIDRDADDGAMLEARPRGTSTLTVVLDARGLPPAAFARGSATRIWVNAWFDWNQDGDWDDGAAVSGAPEWGVQNVPIVPRSLGRARVATVPIRFRTGAVPAEFWWRVQVHVGDRAPHAGGAGLTRPYEHGETEDSFHRTAPPPRAGGSKLPALVCGPRAVIEHGREGRVTAFLVGGTPRRGLVMEGSRVVRVTGARDGVVVGLPGYSHVKGWVRAPVKSLERHARSPLIQVPVVHFQATAFKDGDRFVVRAACPAVVDHAPTLAPRRVPQPQAGPAQPPPGDGGGSGPTRVDPETAACRASVMFGGATALVSLGCDGVDVRSSSAFTTLSSITSVHELGSRALACRVESERRVARCLWRAPNRGSELAYEYAAERDIRSVRLYVLAGGSAGGIGTTVVLLQDWLLGSRGVTCVQSVPKAAACATR